MAPALRSFIDAVRAGSAGTNPSRQNP
jgi:hypothetical protein